MQFPFGFLENIQLLPNLVEISMSLSITGFKLTAVQRVVKNEKKEVF